MTKYLFKGGLPCHPRKGDQCTISWQLETDKNYYIVEFIKKVEGRPNIEICHIDNLINVEKGKVQNA